MNSKLIYKLLALVIIASTLITACATSATTQAPTASGPGAIQPPGSPTATAAAAAKNFQGVNLRFVGANHPWMDAIKKYIPDFEKLTGMKVTVESYGEDQLTQKLTTEFTAGNSTIDVFMQRPLQEARVMKQNG